MVHALTLRVLKMMVDLCAVACTAWLLPVLLALLLLLRLNVAALGLLVRVQSESTLIKEGVVGLELRLVAGGLALSA